MLISLAVLSLLALEVTAFWRLPCRGTLTTERLDPLVQFDSIAEHVHSIHGGSGFSRSCTAADLKKSTCSSCQVKEDMSAYWTPTLYFRDSEGKFEAVKQIGGMLVRWISYYLIRGENVRAFPDNFRMIAGDANLRNFPWRIVEKSLWNDEDRSEAALRQKAIAYTCLNYDLPANSALAVYELPQKPLCKDGLRTEVFFPSCWNGELDSADHRDHLRYPDLMDTGNCPKGYEKRLVSLFYETIWDVNKFYEREGEFMWSTGDPTGYGYHADFMTGWDKDVLQEAIDTCTSPSGRIDDCDKFTLISENEMKQCKIAPTTDEDVFGPMSALPGCNPVEYGREKATKPGCKKPTAGPSPTKTSTEKPMTTPVFKPKQDNNNVPNLNFETSTSSSPPIPPPAATSPPVVLPGNNDIKPDSYDDVDKEVVVVTVTRTEFVEPAETTTTLGYRKRAVHAHHHKGRFIGHHHRR